MIRFFSFGAAILLMGSWPYGAQAQSPAVELNREGFIPDDPAVKKRQPSSVGVKSVLPKNGIGFMDPLSNELASPTGKEPKDADVCLSLRAGSLALPQEVDGNDSVNALRRAYQKGMSRTNRFYKDSCSKLNDKYPMGKMLSDAREACSKSCRTKGSEDKDIKKSFTAGQVNVFCQTFCSKRQESAKFFVQGFRMGAAQCSSGSAVQTRSRPFGDGKRN